MTRPFRLTLRMALRHAPKVAGPPPREGRTVVAHEPSPSCPHFADHAEVQVDSCRVVYHCAGVTFTFPGPVIPGGIRSLVQGPGTLTFVDGHGQAACSIARHYWGEEASRRLIETSLAHGISLAVSTTPGVDFGPVRAVYPLEVVGA